MQILSPKYLFINGQVHENLSVIFNEKIVAVGEYSDLKKRFPSADEVEIGTESLLVPGFVNPHVHLEYSHNRNSYEYGDFIRWLESVVNNFGKFASDSDIQEALDEVLYSGTTTIGAITSYGKDIEILKKSPIRKVVFAEAIASQPHHGEQFKRFLELLKIVEDVKDERLIPAVAIHSPYSLHPDFVSKVVEISKEKGYLLSTHFMESEAEKIWLDSGNGKFHQFYSKLYGEAKRWTTAKQFLSQLSGINSIYVHCNYASKEELMKLKESGGKVVTSPTSNRLLGNRKLNISILDDLGISWGIGTDGMSSNISLDMRDELRNMLYLYDREDLVQFAKKIFVHATKGGADILNIDAGEIAEGKKADMVVISLKDKFSRIDEAILYYLLYKYPIEKIFIEGKEVA